MTSGALEILERDFDISLRELKDIAGSIRREMVKGLSGSGGSLKMIPAYLARPTGREEGEYIALDLGGTNFRVLSLRLKGRGVCPPPRVMKFALRKKDVTSTGKRLFKFLAVSVKKFIRKEKIDPRLHSGIGFTFSFPVRQRGAASGELVVWTKGFSAGGVEGRDVVRLLDRALREEGVAGISVAALANDTVGTLAYRSYSDADCDVAVIIGTGTNACYVEEIRNIRKLGRGRRASGSMMINIEWGNFNGLKATRYDRHLDKESSNPGAQILEKMVSGLYIGEICRLIMIDLAYRKALFGSKFPPGLRRRMSLKGEDVSQILGDRSSGLRAVESVLRRLGAKGPLREDARAVRRICEVVSLRAARISAAAIAGAVTKMDPALRRKHTVAIDGSVYEKMPGFSANIRRAIAGIAGRRAGNIYIKLTKDGSGCGAAVLAAVAEGR